jgi:hypothetical protein
MTKPEYIIPPQRPFVLFSTGLDGYEGEHDLWDLPGEKITVYHVLVRIKHEMELLKERTGRDFYLFGTSKNFVRARQKLIDNYGRSPIDIFFTVNLSDLGKLDRIEMPSPEKVKRSSRRWRTMVNVENGQSEAIPDEIHLWGDDSRRAYYGLSIASLQVFGPKEHRHLMGKHLCHYLLDSPVKGWSQFRMGTLRVDLTVNPGTVQDRRILATARLVYPYIYQIRK